MIAPFLERRIGAGLDNATAAKATLVDLALAGHSLS
jgi:hypothetical protein